MTVLLPFDSLKFVEGTMPGMHSIFPLFFNFINICTCTNNKTESQLEGVDKRKLKFTTLNTPQVGVSVRIKTKSGREEKTNQPRK
jgi:hypothetical protein